MEDPGAFLLWAGGVGGWGVNVNTVTGQLFYRLRDLEPDLAHMLLPNQGLHCFPRLPTQLDKISASSLPHFPTCLLLSLCGDTENTQCHCNSCPYHLFHFSQYILVTATLWGIASTQCLIKL